MPNNITLTLDKQWLQKVLDAAYGYADDAGDVELTEWLTTLSETAIAADEPMNFVVALRVKNNRVGLNRYSTEDLKTIGVSLWSPDERSTIQLLASTVDSDEFKAAFVEGANRDFAAYVGRPQWSDQQVRNSGSKMRATDALILAEILRRLNTTAARHNKTPIPTLKPALTYRLP